MHNHRALDSAKLLPAISFLLVMTGCTGAQSAETSSAATAQDESSDVPPAETDPTEAQGTPSEGPDNSGAPIPEDEPPAQVAPEFPGPSITPESLSTLGPNRSTSIGSPNTGRLQGGVPLPWLAPGLVSNPARINPLAYFGTVEMVQALVNAAAFVHETTPGGTLKINDLGFEEGGDIPHHGSHTAGRDVDVLFYLLTPNGEPREGKGVPIDPNGVGWDFGDLVDPEDDVEVRLDVPRTWQFLEAIAMSDDAFLQRVYVAEHIRSLLMAHAEEVGAPARALRRIGHMTCQPGTPHDDHLHLRFYCATDDIAQGCQDKLPLYPWHRRVLAAAEVEAVIAPRRPRPPRTTRRVSAQEARRAAREAAGPMHERVEAFLDQREAWADKPSPGRPFCR